jgi:hypothetical protein
MALSPGIASAISLRSLAAARSIAIASPSGLIRLRNERTLTAPISHQKRPRQNATTGLEIERKCRKINKADLYPPARRGRSIGAPGNLS